MKTLTSWTLRWLYEILPRVARRKEAQVDLGQVPKVQEVEQWANERPPGCIQSCCMMKNRTGDKKVHNDTHVAPIGMHRPLLHDLHSATDDRPNNKDNGQDTWIHSACASYPLA
ncbi:hypothetical protein HanIR_Chr17g0868901 [Helianthus annuus]|nr:hypothetical protein HanIR_Chr17g0868901 [Helianthus annuus]